MKETFLMCGEWEKHLALLTDEQAGELLRAIFAYQNRREAPSCDPLVFMAFSFMQSFFDESHARYEEKVRVNRENGKLGGRPKKADGFNQNPEKPKETLSESESDSDSESLQSGGGFHKHMPKEHFHEPTLEEVSDYVSQRKSPVIPQEFIDFYAAKGWLVGKTPMKDWKAALRNAEKWDRWEKGKKPNRLCEDLESQERFKQDMGRLDQLLKRTTKETDEKKEGLC